MAQLMKGKLGEAVNTGSNKSTPEAACSDPRGPAKLLNSETERLLRKAQKAPRVGCFWGVEVGTVRRG